MAGTHQIAALPRSGTDAVGVLGATAFFEIFNFQNRQEELWKSDGTTSGTGFVATIPFTTEFTASGGKLFFVANDGTHGYELWATDGTAAGTRHGRRHQPRSERLESLPADRRRRHALLRGPEQYGGGQPALDERRDGGGHEDRGAGARPRPDRRPGRGVVFTGVDASGNPGLWSSDGTTAGTHEIASLPDGSASGLAVAGGTVFFGFYPDPIPIPATSSSGRAMGLRRGRPPSPP